MRTNKTIRNDGASVAGWANGVLRWYLFTNGGTCNEDDAALQAILTTIDNLAISRAQKLAQVIAITSATEPAAQEGYHWALRDCGAQEEQIVVSANPADFVEEGGEDPGATDPNAESDIIYFTSNTNDDGGGI